MGILHLVTVAGLLTLSFILITSTKLQPETLVRTGGTFLASRMSKKQIEVDEKSPHRQLYRQWKNCLAPKLEIYRERLEDTWPIIPTVVYECVQILDQAISVKEYNNGEESKFHISPRQSGTTETMVTLGIGENVQAEEKLLQDFKNIEFYGADPISHKNEELYSRFGKYFPFAVGASSGFSHALVFEGGNYHPKTVVHVDIIYFLTKMIGKKFYDNILFDAEGAEYDLLPYFHKGGVFDQNDITICQFNMEIHFPDQERIQQIGEFLLRTLEDERYVFMRAFDVIHLRIYFVNFSNKECADKYLPK